ncbi:hypothetical protein OG698_42190 [Streptomyces sp. NBC_01003]|nr:hypothetical protein OG698_42190 [Streptomyces sp. NBC_01003]
MDEAVDGPAALGVAEHVHHAEDQDDEVRGDPGEHFLLGDVGDHRHHERRGQHDETHVDVAPHREAERGDEQDDGQHLWHGHAGSSRGRLFNTGQVVQYLAMRSAM